MQTKACCASVESSCFLKRAQLRQREPCRPCSSDTGKGHGQLAQTIRTNNQQSDRGWDLSAPVWLKRYNFTDDGSLAGGDP
jgi:hypothetical protein